MRLTERRADGELRRFAEIHAADFNTGKRDLPDQHEETSSRLEPGDSNEQDNARISAYEICRGRSLDMSVGVRLRLASIGACLLALTACAAIPLSTMWKMRNTKAERLFESDPHQLRVAIRTDDLTKRGSGQPQMRIDIDGPSTKPICYAFALDAIVIGALTEARLEPAMENRRWYAFGLSKQGLDAFERARREVRTKELEGSNFALNVTLNDVLIPAESAISVPFRIDLLLDRKDGYFTMLNEIKIKVTRGAEGGGPAPAAARKPPPVADVQMKPACTPAV